jgi:tRNA1(Val) A37 N6-methylase TrmN6
MVSKRSPANLPKGKGHVFEPDYPLQGSSLDVPLAMVLSMSPIQRTRYIRRLLIAFTKEIEAEQMALKAVVPFKKEMRELRSLVRSPADKFLYTDENTFKRNVLGKGSPGGSHTYWSRKQMWKMGTTKGDLPTLITEQSPQLIATLEKLFDGTNKAKDQIRSKKKTAIQNALTYMEWNAGVGTAFPPFHAKFLVDRFLPSEGDSIVFDPCVGWGGRMLGTLCVNRLSCVQYIGTDPEKRNKDAYEGIQRRVSIYLKDEIPGERSAKIYYRPFEDWINTPAANKLKGKVDLVMTSPPYFSAENYNTSNKKQSANRYTTYEQWREGFYSALVEGAFNLLKPGGVFVLNIANVKSAESLEKDARIIARQYGFVNAGFYKLAMSVVPGSRGNIRHTVVVNGSTFKHEPVFCFRKPVK